jgi:hypothetical protein
MFYTRDNRWARGKGVRRMHCTACDAELILTNVVPENTVTVRILEGVLLAAVQGKLAAQAVARRCRLRGSPALLTDRIFDECGNRMGPTHTNKGGARYRLLRLRGRAAEETA